MKKAVFIFLMLLIGSSYSFAQYDATVRVPDIDITGLNAGDTFIIPFIMDSKTAGGLITGFQTYIDFDHTIMSWNGTFADPTPGVSFFNPLMPYNGNGNDWTINDNTGENAMFAFWMDPNFMGVDVPDGETFIAFIFTYNGGLNPGESSPLTMSLTKNVGGKITNKGATEMYDQNFGYYNLTLVNGSIFVGGGGEWTGAVSDDWFDGDNWNPLGVPADGTDITIPVVAKASYPVLTGAATTGALTVAANAMLTVAPGGQLTTSGMFQNDGYFYITSDTTGAAGSFIDNGGLSGSGYYRFDRHMHKRYYFGSLAPPEHGWHLISSPVNNTVSGDFASYWLNEWDNDNNTYVPIDPYPGPTFCDGTSYGNIRLNPLAGDLEMKGFAVKRDTTYPNSSNPPSCPCWVPPLYEMPGFGSYPAMDTDYIAFGGDAYGTYTPNAGGCGVWPGWNWVDNATNVASMSDVNNGNYSINVDWNGVPGDDFSGPFHAWNLLGNPYSSPISCASFTGNFPTQVNASISYWDDKYLTYQVWAGGVGVPEIPATQGFMVKVNTAGTYAVGVATTDRTHNGAGNYYKSEINDLLTLQATGNGYVDKTYIRFLDDATNGFDRVWDANKLLSTASGVPQIYTTSSSETFAINALPATTSVPMAFTSATSGTYTIEAIETSEFANVVLEDKYTGIETDLLNDSYTFEFVANDNPNRFIVHFTPLGTPELEANSIRIWASERNIYVSVPETVTGDVAVYNMMGQEVVANKVISGMNVIPVNDVNTYYVVKVRSNSNVKTEKVFIR